VSVLTLALDASTQKATVAIGDGERVLVEYEIAMRDPNQERLMPAVAHALEQARVPVSRLERIVCGGGPGGFTGLRIAAAIAKGVAVGTGTPLFVVSSLALIVAASPWAGVAGRYVTVLDALRGEVFAAAFEVMDAQPAMIQPPVRLARGALDAMLSSLRARAIGPDEELAAWPHARGALRLPAASDLVGEVDRDRWEPAYGRDAEAQVKWEAVHGRPLPR